MSFEDFIRRSINFLSSFFFLFFRFTQYILKTDCMLKKYISRLKNREIEKPKCFVNKVFNIGVLLRKVVTVIGMI